MNQRNWRKNESEGRIEGKQKRKKVEVYKKFVIFSMKKFVLQKTFIPSLFPSKEFFVQESLPSLSFHKRLSENFKEGPFPLPFPSPLPLESLFKTSKSLPPTFLFKTLFFLPLSFFSLFWFKPFTFYKLFSSKNSSLFITFFFPRPFLVPFFSPCPSTFLSSFHP